MGQGSDDRGNSDTTPTSAKRSPVQPKVTPAGPRGVRPSGRFGGMSVSPPTDAPANWQINPPLSPSPSVDELAVWEARRREIFDWAGALVAQRSLQPIAPPLPGEIADFERCHRGLLVLEDDFIRSFTDDAFVRLQRVRVWSTQTFLLAQLGGLYQLDGNPSASNEAICRAAEALRTAEQLVDGLLRPSTFRRLLRLFPWVRQPSRSELRETATKLCQAREILEKLTQHHSRRAQVAVSQTMLLLEHSAAEIKCDLPGDASGLLHRYSAQLAFLYGLQSELGTGHKLSARTSAYLKTLEGWLACGVARQFLALGDIFRATYFGSEATLALEHALSIPPDDGAAVVVAGTPTPEWLEIQKAQLHLKDSLSRLRSRLPNSPS
jgi:hypothetical protein